MVDERDALLWLSLAEISSQKQALIFRGYGSAAEFYEVFNSEKSKIVSFLTKDALNRLSLSYGEEFLCQQKQYLKHSSIEFVTIADDEYPELLSQPETDPPKLLYYSGDISLLKSQCIGVVGTRTPSPYGKNQCRRFVPVLCDAGLTVVSGFASGIDTAAHTAAVEAGGKTIAVLGCGIKAAAKIYNPFALDNIIKEGLVISEYPPDKAGAKYTFPQRNRIISGLCLGTLVVEAGQKSGALITAEFALEQNRELFALCGNIGNAYSVGTNNLIKTGKAQLVTEPEDILRYLKILAKPKKKLVLALDFFEQKLYNLLTVGQKSFDELADESGMDAVSLNSCLCQMELKGIINKLPQNFYSLR